MDLLSEQAIINNEASHEAPTGALAPPVGSAAGEIFMDSETESDACAEPGDIWLHDGTHNTGPADLL